MFIPIKICHSGPPAPLSAIEESATEESDTRSDQEAATDDPDADKPGIAAGEPAGGLDTESDRPPPPRPDGDAR